jgi:glutamine phosphoribosylpyrophosphate amidotransferase
MDIAYGNGRFVGVGGSSITISEDGTNWTKQFTPPNLSSIVYAHGMFVAVGSDGWILSSVDGTEWTRHPSQTTQNLYDVATGCDSFVAVGDDGTILQSDPIFFTPLTIRRQPQSQAVQQGERVSFEVLAVGSSPRYQWF